MTISIIPDLIEGASFSLTANGPVATRVFGVFTDASESMTEILATPPIPAYGAAYPGTGGLGEFAEIVALEIQCVPESSENTKYKVIVSYGLPDLSQKEASDDPEDSLIQLGSTVSSGKTTKDKNGTQITVSLTDNPTQTGEVEVQIPQTVVVFERKESTSPLTKSIAFAGTVNTSTIGDFAARTLLCLGIEGTSSDDGLTWQVTYRFQYNANTWDATVVYVDPDTGRPHDDINIGTSDGVTVARVYPESNFSTLDLNW